ncbi:MAG: hypothetical protein Q7L55_11935 [Actinomycetota bacterium]|jgi:hypothetical protein|nr:hypothetical protein [Actinomycetota bacterium]
MDRDVLMHQMTERFREAYAKGLDAVERAPDGQWIAASEFVFRDAFLEVMKESYQAAIQAKIDADSSRQAGTFSPSEPGTGGSGAATQQGEARRSRPDDRRRH